MGLTTAARTRLMDGVTTLHAVLLAHSRFGRGQQRSDCTVTLAERQGRDLAACGIEVVAMGGITNTRAFALRYGPQGLGVRLAGLYDAPDEAKLRRGLLAAGLDAATRKTFRASGSSSARLIWRTN